MRKIIGYTSKQEVRAGAWVSYGIEKVYQISMQIFTSKALAQKVYGADGVRKVKVTLSEIREA